MNYHRDNGRQKKRIWLFVFLFAVALIFLEQHKIMPPLQEGTAFISAPILRGASAIKKAAQDGFFSVFSSKYSLVSENNALKKEVREYEAKLLDRDRLFAENTELKALLGRDAGIEKNLLAAILAKPNQSPYDTLLLDVGSENGVKVGDTVTTYDSIAIGKIKDVYSSTSRAVLFTSPGEEHQGTLLGSNIPLKLTGRGGGNFIIELSREVSVLEETPVFSIGLSPRILGVVEGIFTDPRDPFQSILVRSPINMAELKWVLIIL